jgi:hypothetical protein
MTSADIRAALRRLGQDIAPPVPARGLRHRILTQLDGTDGQHAPGDTRRERRLRAAPLT